jgi:hypothetical protein
MPQVGWWYEGRKWLHAELREHLAQGGGPVTPTALDGMLSHERTYMSPTMLNSCPRQLVLKRELNYFEPVDYAMPRYRGTLVHKFLEIEEHEPGSLIEVPLSIPVELSSGMATLQGRADKVLPGEGHIIDYKTTNKPITRPKDGWYSQLSCYRWMVEQQFEGVEIDRCTMRVLYVPDDAEMIEIFESGDRELMLSMVADMRDIELQLWPRDKTERYIKGRMERVIGAMDGTYSLDNLPGMLDPLFDSDLYWLCLEQKNGKMPWCPVAGQCKALAREGM